MSSLRAYVDDLNRYVQAARHKWEGDSDISVSEDWTEVTPTDDGAWITAAVFVHNDELEPKPGPTYVVWSCALNPEGTAFGPWLCNGTFICDEDDVDGRQARANAHEYARSLRRQYPAALVAVRPAEKRLLTPRFNG